MAYMTRLGLWGPGSPFPSGFDEFKEAVDRGGVGAKSLYNIMIFMLFEFIIVY